MATKKPEIEQFIQAFNSSSVRTRTLLIGLLFASILAFIALLDSFVPFLSWYSSRIEIRQVALQWFVFPEDIPEEYSTIVLPEKGEPNQDGTATTSSNPDQQKDKKTVENPARFTHADSIRIFGFDSIFEFAKSLEEKDSERWTDSEIEAILYEAVNLDSLYYLYLLTPNKSELPYWVRIKTFESFKARSLPGKERRKRLYQSLSRAAAVFNGYSPRSKKEFEYALENLMEAQSENLTLVRMPILGITFDINFLGFIGGGIFCALMALLYLSMVREGRNLKTLFQRGWEEDKEDFDAGRLYELLSMYQVLTVPQKLFRPDDYKDMHTRKFILGIFWFPFAVLALIFSYDLYSFKIGLSLNPLMTVSTSCLTLVSLVIIGITSRKLTDRQIRINRLWDNQYFRLHLENLISPDVQQRDASPFATPEQAKINWANAAYKASREKKLSEEDCVERFRMFLNLCYDKFEDQRNPLISDAAAEIYWEKLKTWFENNKQHSMRKRFREELTKLMNDLSTQK